MALDASLDRDRLVTLDSGLQRRPVAGAASGEFENQMDLRKCPRLAVQLPISFSGDTVTGEGIVFNLSTEGCTVGSDKPVQKGTQLELRVQLPDRELPMEVALAVVEWSYVQKFGCKFVRMGTDEQARLGTFVRSHPDVPSFSRF